MFWWEIIKPKEDDRETKSKGSFLCPASYLESWTKLYNRAHYNIMVLPKQDENRNFKYGPVPQSMWHTQRFLRDWRGEMETMRILVNHDFQSDLVVGYQCYEGTRDITMKQHGLRKQVNQMTFLPQTRRQVLFALHCVIPY